MKFVIPKKPPPKPESPEALFRELRPPDSRVRDLYLRQGDLLRKYQAEGRQHSDVALEMQTGAGKTLVGLLIGEFRRRALDQRVAYLCPTVQLAKQVAAKAESYGIGVVTLVRRQADWDAADFNRFARTEAIAVSTYSAVFNSNPRLSSAQTLVLDDAHAAEDTVSALWSVSISRETPLYRAVLGVVSADLPAEVAARLADNDLDPRARFVVDLTPPLTVASHAIPIAEALGAHCKDQVDPNYYSIRMIGDAVGRCLMYLSWSQILIRPLIPPSSEHPPFASADQRVYMSATIGEEGDLERSFGVSPIHHLRADDNSEEYTFGRRFFMFPDASLHRQPSDALIKEFVSQVDRALVLTPSAIESDRVKDACIPEGWSTLGASSVEDNFQEFVGHSNVALILANRYDGIDLPDDACRLILISGLPARTHLQERFFLERLGAARVLSERIRTRVVQGAGRCTRNNRDYAAVIVRGQRLQDFYCRDEEVRVMRPDLQAEIEFGLANAEQDPASLVGLLREFLKQSSTWLEAEEGIRSLAQSMRSQPPTGASALASAAPFEVEAWRAAWRGDLKRAIAVAQGVTDALIGGDDLRPYRAFWFYIAAAWSAASNGIDHRLTKELIKESEGAARTLRWFPHFPAAGQVEQLDFGEEFDARADHAATTLLQLGIRGSKFESEILRIETEVASDEANTFARGVAAIGRLLGFEGWTPSGFAAPDIIWRNLDLFWVLFEAKTEEAHEGVISAETVRQAQTHQTWTQKELAVGKGPSVSVTCVISYRSQVDRAAAKVAKEETLASPEVLRRLAKAVTGIHRSIRSNARGMSHAQLVESYREAFRVNKLDDADIKRILSVRRITDG